MDILSIGEVPARPGVPASTIRYFDRIGLLSPPERQRGRRRYSADVLHSLALLRLGRAARHRVSERGTSAQGLAGSVGKLCSGVHCRPPHRGMGLAIASDTQRIPMLSHLAVALATVIQAQPAQDARQLLLSAAANQEQRWSAVNNYTIVQTVNGTPVPLYCEKVSTCGRITFRSVPISE
jgi:hypothetical protein